ncbi:uncharacterized protein At4g06598 [Typha latifolia]|uniref:uncharacterized protein At4g06598 n=1 Tax=Typha latifolia TaxID=4733 RepID=UPI003C2C16E5
MSHPAQLPPRCPLQRRSSLPLPLDLASHTTQRDDGLHANYNRFPSQPSLFNEQPSWFDDLLSESDRSPVAIALRRSSSDSEVILDTLASFPNPIYPIDEGDSGSNEDLHKVEENTGESEVASGLEASCIYGPNSPRQKDRLTASECSMVSAVLENVPRNPLQYVIMDATNGTTVSELNSKGDIKNVQSEGDPEKVSRRRSGQRSRVRKLQYIAELERTVNTLQNVVAELTARGASLFELRAALSVENQELRRQIASLHQEKLFKDGQRQCLKNEAERLKSISSRHRRSKSACFEVSPLELDLSAISQQMVRKLNLKENPVPPKHGH